MAINVLTPEQIEKAKAAKSVDELLALAKEEGIELTDEQLEAINGGVVTAPCRDHGGGATWSE